MLLEGLPKAGLERILPVDGAFYLYADVSRFSSDSFAFAKQMLEEAHVAATPGIDFDPVSGSRFVRFCYAGATTDMQEAVTRITNGWRRGRDDPAGASAAFRNAARAAEAPGCAGVQSRMCAPSGRHGVSLPRPACGERVG